VVLLVGSETAGDIGLQIDTDRRLAAGKAGNKKPGAWERPG
jgi:hypothetical protein